MKSIHKRIKQVIKEELENILQFDFQNKYGFLKMENQNLKESLEKLEKEAAKNWHTIKKLEHDFYTLKQLYKNLESNLISILKQVENPNEQTILKIIEEINKRQLIK